MGICCEFLSLSYVSDTSLYNKYTSSRLGYITILLVLLRLVLLLRFFLRVLVYITILS
jgi:hypothetical protein